VIGDQILLYILRIYKLIFQDSDNLFSYIVPDLIVLLQILPSLHLQFNFQFQMSDDIRFWGFRCATHRAGVKGYDTQAKG